jgi:hypothetical protein
MLSFAKYNAEPDAATAMPGSWSILDLIFYQPIQRLFPRVECGKFSPRKLF